MLQLRHVGQVQQPLVGELPGAAEAQRRHVIQCGDARQHRVRHQPAGIERGDLPLFHDRDEFVPFAVGQLSPRRDPAFRGVDRICRNRRRAGRHRLRQGFPTAKPGILRDDGLRFGRLKRLFPVAFERPLSERVHAAPHLGPQVVEGERALVVRVQALEPGLVVRVERSDHIVGQLLVLFSCSRSRRWGDVHHPAGCEASRLIHL